MDGDFADLMGRTSEVISQPIVVFVAPMIVAVGVSSSKPGVLDNNALQCIVNSLLAISSRVTYVFDHALVIILVPETRCSPGAPAKRLDV